MSGQNFVDFAGIVLHSKSGDFDDISSLHDQGASQMLTDYDSGPRNSVGEGCLPRSSTRRSHPSQPGHSEPGFGSQNCSKGSKAKQENKARVICWWRASD